MSMYFNLCFETVRNVLADNRDKEGHDLQKVLYKAFPFHSSNLLAWREYQKEITRQSGYAFTPENNYSAVKRKSK